MGCRLAGPGLRRFVRSPIRCASSQSDAPVVLRENLRPKVAETWIWTWHCAPNLAPLVAFGGARVLRFADFAIDAVSAVGLSFTLPSRCGRM